VLVDDETLIRLDDDPTPEFPEPLRGLDPGLDITGEISRATSDEVDPAPEIVAEPGPAAGTDIEGNESE
jgi:hypothetical protein